MSIQLYDTTLRDGVGGEGISFSAIDKVHIARKLDELGIHFIEGGWPSSNPKDAEFFKKARKISFRTARLVAFGSTRRPKSAVENDANINALIEAGVKTVTIVGKSSAPQVINVLETTLEENLGMVADSIAYLKARGLTVFFDAEHFFNGFKADMSYALHILEAAAQAGADCLILCDTNGGALPGEIVSACTAAKQATRLPLGIHAHNDGDLATANTLAAVQAGATMV